MKRFILWLLFGVFLYLAITAVDMGEYAIAAVMAVISVGCLFAAPGGAKKKAKSRR